MRTYISGEFTENTLADKAKFDSAENSLREMGHFPVNPFSISPSGRITWPVRIDILAGCEAIYLLPDWLKSRDAMVEKYYCEMNEKTVMFQSSVEAGSERERKEKIIVSRILDAIHEVMGLTLSDCIEENREPKRFFARMIFYRHCDRSGMKPERSLIYVPRDRTTVLHALRKFNNEYKYNREFREIVCKVSERIGAEIVTIDEP